MLNQKKVEIFLAKFHKSPAKQFLEIAFNETTSQLVVRQPLVVSLTRCLVDLSTCSLRSYS